MQRIGVKPLRIAVTADPELPVPPKHYGGIERIVEMLVRGLVERGHEVTLFAHPESRVPCRLEPYPGRRSLSKIDTLRNMWHVSSKVLRGKFDIVHSFGRLAYLLPILPLPIPKVMTYQRAITPRSVRWGDRLSRGTLYFTGVSRYIVKPYEKNGNWFVVYNGAPTSYTFTEHVPEDAPLIYLGRIEEFKGPHIAIEVALRSKRPLILAGNVPNEPKAKKYFEERVAPYIDGTRIKFVGPVNDIQKNELLCKSLALLFPLLGEDALPVVMAEALACGTPIIGFNRGPVPEVIQNGVNGFLCDSIEDMVQSIERVRDINRRDCRRIMEEKFSDRAIIDNYEQIYFRILEHGSSLR